MRWPWQKPAPPPAPELFDIRHNGTYFEVLTSVHRELFGGDMSIEEIWEPYISELMRHRAVEERPGVIAQPPTSVYDELIAEGWTPPSDRDLPPVLCLEQYNRPLPKMIQRCVCHMLAGHSGDHHDQVNGIAWR